jgi:hypothetical protein
VKRKSQIYFLSLGLALLLFGLGALLTPHVDGNVAVGLLRFVVLCLAVASSIGAWASAVAIVSVHKVTWPLYVLVCLVVLASIAFAAATYPSAGALG